ncbi:hypothetical protein FOXG_20057 [Fusarium oxysporum f. sp. lycopersici 4287]|uniref:Uncharacterized protein n=1 Tax=Fusarium oxysporum f. sp. lycopersici (strain 4287 / CBS 123668 / FGSC 9935 / NRRL 34936) TaxID=426428 RepID=A0A0J9VCT5_FUSO4|nr:hypothetical protein FOXG_20057 [Fusarium oxysporum f. sp. lycopersici 4287]KNB08726.1 hypothetical protein FOXG_20057 [Fusarium oxysporum f. sp. lycopersici 4287]
MRSVFALRSCGRRGSASLKFATFSKQTLESANAANKSIFIVGAEAVALFFSNNLKAMLLALAERIQIDNIYDCGER